MTDISNVQSNYDLWYSIQWLFIYDYNNRNSSINCYRVSTVMYLSLDIPTGCDDASFICAIVNLFGPLQVVLIEAIIIIFSATLFPTAILARIFWHFLII